MNAAVGLPADEHSSFLRGPVHLPLDLDLLDPALAPGTPHHEPGGFVAPAVIWLIQNLRTPPGGTDIVEYDPRRDVQAVSANAATCILGTGSDQE
jgi:arginase family enzyme